MPRCRRCDHWYFPWKLNEFGRCETCEVRTQIERKKMAQHDQNRRDFERASQLAKARERQINEQALQDAANRIVKAMPRHAPGSKEGQYFKVSYDWDDNGTSARFEAPLLDVPDFLVDSLSKPWIALHFATTGLLEGESEILSIGAVLVENNEVTDTFYRLIKPRKGLPVEASDYNGITPDMVKNAPSIIEVLPDFAEFVGNRICVAHNPLFIYKFLLATTEHLKLPFLYLECADSVEIGARYWPDLHNHKLISLEYLIHGNNIEKPTSLQQAHIIVDVVKAAQIRAKDEIHYRTLDKRILQVIATNDALLQKDLPRYLPEDSPSRITSMVKKLSEDGKIFREKRGATYMLSLPSNSTST